MMNLILLTYHGEPISKQNEERPLPQKLDSLSPWHPWRELLGRDTGKVVKIRNLFQGLSSKGRTILY